MTPWSLGVGWLQDIVVPARYLGVAPSFDFVISSSLSSLLLILLLW